MQHPRATAVPSEQLKPFAPGIDWAVLAGDGMTLVYWVFDFPACGEVPMHSHDIAQGGVVLEGSLVILDASGGQRTLRSGDFYTLARNEQHGVRFTERCVVMDVFAPNRPEYEERYAAGTQSAAFA